MPKRDDWCETIGQRLRQLRKEKDLTQEELAEKAGINAKYYVQIERGRRNLSIGCLRQISDGLEVPLATIFSFPSDRPMKADDEELVALTIKLIIEGNKKSKLAVKALLKELLR